MSLASQVHLPTKKVVLPKSKETINIRPYTSREQKSLRMAVESKKAESVSSTLLAVMQACITEKVNLNKFYLIDLEFLFLQMHMISSGSHVNIGQKCLIEKDGVVCGNEFEVEIDMEQVNFKFFDGDETKTFELGPTLKIEVQKPRGKEVFDKFTSLMHDNKSNSDDETIATCISKIYLDDEPKEPSDYDTAELLELVDALPITIKPKIEEFISEADELVITKNVTCSKCGTVHELEYKGLPSFLD